jgi:hypothetical protein
MEIVTTCSTMYIERAVLGLCPRVLFAAPGAEVQLSNFHDAPILVRRL